MQIKPQEPQKLFSAKADAYSRYISLFLYPQGLHAFFAGADWLRNSLRILDAGCGTGVVTFGLLKALNRRGYEFDCVNAFDLTPAMLEIFRKGLEQRGIKKVDLCQANVLALEELPSSWTSYDVIVSASMLEYIPKDKLPETLASLRSRLSEGGRFILFMTRRNWLTELMIERPWGGNRYSRQELAEAFASAGFRRSDVPQISLELQLAQPLGLYCGRPVFKGEKRLAARISALLIIQTKIRHR